MPSSKPWDLKLPNLVAAVVDFDLEPAEFNAAGEVAVLGQEPEGVDVVGEDR
eukprot:gene26156-11880_t